MTETVFTDPNHKMIHLDSGNIAIGLTSSDIALEHILLNPDEAMSLGVALMEHGVAAKQAQRLKV